MTTIHESLHPFFRCEEDADGTVILHYYSKRRGLYPIVTGMCPAYHRVCQLMKKE